MRQIITLIGLCAIVIAIVWGCSANLKNQKALNRVLASDSLTTLVYMRTHQPDSLEQAFIITASDTLAGSQADFQYPDTADLAEENRILRRHIERMIWYTLSPIDTTLPTGVRIVVTRGGLYATTQRREMVKRIFDNTAAKAWRDSCNRLQERLSVANINSEHLASLLAISEKKIQELEIKQEQLIDQTSAQKSSGRRSLLWLLLVPLFGYLAIRFGGPWLLASAFVKGLFGLKNKKRTEQKFGTTLIEAYWVRQVNDGRWQYGKNDNNGNTVMRSEIYDSDDEAIAKLNAYRLETNTNHINAFKY